MPKASFVPQHYAVLFEPEYMLELILALRFYTTEYDHVPVEEVLAALEEAYVGDLPQQQREESEKTD